jgi:hypothetical protein
LRRTHTLLIGLFWRFFSGLDQEAGRPRLQPACCPHKSRQCRRCLPEPRIRRAIFDTVEVRSCRGQLAELKSPRAYHFPRTLSLIATRMRPYLPALLSRKGCERNASFPFLHFHTNPSICTQIFPSTSRARVP